MQFDVLIHPHQCIAWDSFIYKMASCILTTENGVTIDKQF